MLYRVINTAYATIYVWHITETSSELSALLSPYKELALFDIEETQKTKLWHHTHFLSTRLMLYKYAKLHAPIFKDEFGKPMHEGRRISITHSNNYAAVIVSDKKQVALDLEKIDPRIIRVAHKFLHSEENFFNPLEQEIYLTLIWSAKETMYKLYSRNEVIFKDELRISPFKYQEQGSFRGDILKSPEIFNVTIEYLSLGDYILTWHIQN